jgi:hypothetical protein
MAGEPVDEAAVGVHGMEGDRRHALRLEGGRKLTAKVAPKLLAWHASLNGGLTVTGPDGRAYGLDGELERAVTEHLGREVALVHDPRGLGDVTGLHVTVEGSRRRLEEELGMPLDVRRFRPNVHVELDAEPYEEAGWEGRRLRVGAAELQIVSAADRCAITVYDPDTLEKAPDVLRRINRHHDTFFGVWADAVADARIRVGDAVELL